MRQLPILVKREILAYFRTPLAYVFTALFLLTAVACTFFVGGLFESDEASLKPLFEFLPWLLLVLTPAIAMRLWAEERQTGNIELLFTLPISLAEAVLAKFLAAWLLATFVLALTFTLPLTLSYLGQPDWGVMFSAYMGVLLLVGAFLALSCLGSALSKSQASAFVIGLLLCFLTLLLGWGTFTELLGTVLPPPVVDGLAALGVIPHLEPLSQGVVDSRDLLYFAICIGACLFLTAEILHAKKAD